MAPSRRGRAVVILSYVVDWIAIFIIIGIGGAVYNLRPYYRPISLLDLDISFPIVVESISTTTLFLVAIVAPAILIALISLFLNPSPHANTMSKKDNWRRKLWDWNVGWMGLALSVAAAFIITQGVKNLVGEPRPHCLAVCQPDVDNVSKYVVGGDGQDISARWTLVSGDICQNPDRTTLDDAWRSFPSGHSSTSFSGLFYLSLWLCGRWRISFPYLPRSEATPATRNSPSPFAGPQWPSAPPTYLWIPAFVPTGAAIFISSTRYAEFFHHGHDIFIGSSLGILTAYLAYRWYHGPIIGGGGTWGPRQTAWEWEGFRDARYKKVDDLEAESATRTFADEEEIGQNIGDAGMSVSAGR